jgi:hypothetical protein
VYIIYYLDDPLKAPELPAWITKNKISPTHVKAPIEPMPAKLTEPPRCFRVLLFAKLGFTNMCSVPGVGT